MIDKPIYRLTNVELYDYITNGSAQFSAYDLKVELESRKLTVQQIDNLENDHYLYKKLQKERIRQSLTTEEYLTLFILPFLLQSLDDEMNTYPNLNMNVTKYMGLIKNWSRQKASSALGFCFGSCFLFWFF